MGFFSFSLIYSSNDFSLTAAVNTKLTMLSSLQDFRIFEGASKGFLIFLSRLAVVSLSCLSLPALLTQAVKCSPCLALHERVPMRKAPFSEVDKAVQTLCSGIKSKRLQNSTVEDLFWHLSFFRQITKLSRDTLSLVGAEQDYFFKDFFNC